MSGHLDPGLRHLLEESNIEPSDWPKWMPIIDAVCLHNGGLQPTDLDAWSVGDLYQLPTYPPHRTEEFVIGVLQGSALAFGREKGTFKKKLDFRAIELDKVAAAQFWPDDQQLGNNWGTCDVQAVSSGGQPVFRLGWGWGGRTPMAKLRTRLHHDGIDPWGTMKREVCRYSKPQLGGKLAVRDAPWRNGQSCVLPA